MLFHLTATFMHPAAEKFIKHLTLTMSLLKIAGRHSVRFMATKPATPLQVALKYGDDEEEARYRTQKNPIIPDVSELPKRWNKLDALKQDDIIAYLEDRMRGDWKELTQPERKAIWYVYYGPWGARGKEQADPGSIYGSFAGFVGVMLLGVVGYQALRKKEPEN